MKSYRVSVAILIVGAVILGFHSMAAFGGLNELTIGDPAPVFELVGSDDATYRLADFRGKQVVVLAWFPKAFTGG